MNACLLIRPLSTMIQTFILNTNTMNFELFKEALSNTSLMGWVTVALVVLYLLFRLLVHRLPAPGPADSGRIYLKIVHYIFLTVLIGLVLFFALEVIKVFN